MVIGSFFLLLLVFKWWWWWSVSVPSSQNILPKKSIYRWWWWWWNQFIFPSLINSCLMTKKKKFWQFQQTKQCKSVKKNWKSFYNDCTEYFFFFENGEIDVDQKKMYLWFDCQKKKLGMFSTTLSIKKFLRKVFFSTRKNSHFSGHQVYLA